MKNENTGYPSKKTWIFIASGFAALSAALGISLALAPDNSPCAKVEAEIVSTWKESQALKARSQKAIDEMSTMIKTAELGGALPNKEKFAKAAVESERATDQLNELTAKIEGFPDKVAEAGCSAERFEKFQKNHPEIFG